MAGPNGKRSLEEIFEEHLAVTKAGFERVNQNIAETALSLRMEMKSGFEQVDKRFERIEGWLDNMLLTMGGTRLDHEARISALEEDVAKLKAG